jgi:SpoVK/Ycf46/Vps4 family AAA+-type ATPase
MLHRIPVAALPTQSPDLENFARLWQRESALMPLALYIDATDLERTSGAGIAALQRLCRRGMGLVFVETHHQWPELGSGSLAFDMMRPTPAEQFDAWSGTLGAGAKETAGRLAAQFNFNLPSIHAIAAGARTRTAQDPARLADVVWQDSLRQARPALDQLAQPLEPKAVWDDLELPAAEKTLLLQIGRQVRDRLAVYDTWGFRARMNRGLGISVLFAGESGTGKTMAAEVLANDLSLMLYRIDLSSVVSKYIGETERNLRKLFDAAEDGGAILFFDEADALFGKRSEVKDSHDRYANIEINYLLQRIETYRGLSILATNMKSALDSAFVRRLRFIVNFPFPGQGERQAIWRKAFPPQAPIAALDHARLARFNLTGGSIHNVALNAAFLAAHAGEPISMRFVLEAIRSEHRKLDKPVNEADFRPIASAAGGGR